MWCIIFHPSPLFFTKGPYCILSLAIHYPEIWIFYVELIATSPGHLCVTWLLHRFTFESVDSDFFFFFFWGGGGRKYPLTIYIESGYVHVIYIQTRVVELWWATPCAADRWGWDFIPWWCRMKRLTPCKRPWRWWSTLNYSTRETRFPRLGSRFCFFVGNHVGNYV
jgi:hypothetical protein